MNNSVLGNFRLLAIQFKFYQTSRVNSQNFFTVNIADNFIQFHNDFTIIGRQNNTSKYQRIFDFNLTFFEALYSGVLCFLQDRPPLEISDMSQIILN